jgi:peptidase E
MYRLVQQLRREIHSRETLEKRCRVLAIVYQTMQVAVSHEKQYIEVEETEEDEEKTAENKDAEVSQSRSRQRANSGRG